MRRFVTGLFVLALLASRGRGEDFAALKKEFDEAAKKYQIELAELPKRNPVNSFVPKFIAFAEKDAKDPGAIDALVEALKLSYTMGLGKDSHWHKALAVLARDHVTNPNPKILDAVLLMTGAGAPEGLAFIRAVMERNPDRKIQARACQLLIDANGKHANTAEQMKVNAAVRQRVEGLIGKEAAAKLQALDSKQLTQEAQELGKILETRYADVLTVIAIGKPAPEVVLKDIDGKDVKLSSLKGKVVILDIWATWCGPCRAMIPHEREMVKKLKDKPFVLVSISADEKLETLKNFVAKEPMPWTHWHNGAHGGIVEAWEVKAYPTLYLLDHKGVIRYKWVGSPGEKLDEAVEKLLKEMDGKTS